MKTIRMAAGASLVGLASLALAGQAWAVSGAAFTTFNAHVDGASKDVCKNSAINCNIYGAKEYVWLNGGPTANGLGPDGDYFFAVLVPGGQPNPNDGGAKNLSDDFDAYTNRVFTVTGGEVSAYAGTHWLDDGKSGPKPNNKVPYIRLFPYADTTNPGGVYILAICSLADGYPVDPRDCKYDAFKVKKGKLEYSFRLEGMKLEDKYADGPNGANRDSVDSGLAGWEITIAGTGPDGLPISASVFTDEDGYWSWDSGVYTFVGSDKPKPVTLTVCEQLETGWYQSYPASNGGCHLVNFTPSGFDKFFYIDFYNHRPVDVSACKDRFPSGTAVAGWPVSLTKEGVVQDTQLTGTDGCYTWTELAPGPSYDVHEGSRTGWEAKGDVDHVFERAQSGDSFSHTFVNEPLQGCTPGFWQGGNAFATAGGQWLWNEDDDPQWPASGGADTNPYRHDDSFCGFFGCSQSGSMWYYVNPDLWTVNDDFHKAARSLVAGYLDASWGMGYAYSTAELKAMWTAAYGSGSLLALHTELDLANNARMGCPISASVK